MRQLDSIDSIEAGKEFERYQAERDEREAQLHDKIADLTAKLEISRNAIRAFLDHRSAVFDAQMRGVPLPDGIDGVLTKLEKAL